MILAAAAIAFTACTKPTPEPEPTPEEANTFQITVSDITATTASVAVTPSDNSVLYYFDILSAENYAEFADDAALMTDYVDYFEELIDIYGQYGYDLTIADFLSQGADDYDFEGLSAETTYYVVAFCFDSTYTPAGSVTKQQFTTLAVQNVSLSFQLQTTDTAIFFVPNDDKITYLYDYDDADTLAALLTNNDMTAPQYFQALWEYVESMYSAYGYTLDDFAAQGTLYLPYLDEDGEAVLEAGHKYVFMAQAYTGGVWNSDFVSYEFAAPANSAAPAVNVKGKLNTQMRLKKAKKINKSDINVTRK